MNTKRTPKLVTLEHWKKLSPRQQGYFVYMQAELPGSELKGQKCPYDKSTPEFRWYVEGGEYAVRVMTDMEE